MKIKTVDLAACALFVAMSAVLSQVSIPIGVVPINLTHVSIFLAAGILGARLGALSQLAYAILGAIGLPIFSGFSGGIGIVLGPTGGFIVGYVVSAFVVGFLIEKTEDTYIGLFASMYAGWLVTYMIGIPWFMVTTGTSNVGAALMACMVPFLPGDLAKTILSTVLVKRLRPVLRITMERQY